jgi:hypothetical protein
MNAIDRVLLNNNKVLIDTLYIFTITKVEVTALFCVISTGIRECNLNFKVKLLYSDKWKARLPFECHAICLMKGVCEWMYQLFSDSPLGLPGVPWFNHLPTQ